MSDFPGSAQLLAVMGRLKSELLKTAIEAPAPRLLDGNLVPVSGGYGLTLPADGPPENWGAGRIVTPDTPRDQLCPILDGWRTRSLATGEVIEADDIAPFSQPELMDPVSTSAAAVLHGCGYIGVSVFDVQNVVDNIGSELHMPVQIDCTIAVPSGRGAAQGLFYCGLLARVLGNAHIQFAPDGEELAFESAQESVPPEEVGAWLVFPWSVTATRQYFVPNPFGTA